MNTTKEQWKFRMEKEVGIIYQIEARQVIVSGSGSAIVNAIINRTLEELEREWLENPTNSDWFQYVKRGNKQEENKERGKREE